MTTLLVSIYSEATTQEAAQLMKKKDEIAGILAVKDLAYRNKTSA
jgi:hypothetical protein